jgi:protease-4
MRRFLSTFLACLLAILVVLAVPLLIAAGKSGKAPKIKKDSWLIVDLVGPLPEYPATAGLPAGLGGGDEPSLTGVLGAFEKAEVDKKIRGAILRVGAFEGGWATREELRNAIGRLRKSGKPVYAWGEYLTPAGYSVCSACDSVFLLPTGGMDWRGFGTRVPHVKRTLEKLGIRPDIHQIERYKSAAELVTREDMSPEAKEVSLRLMGMIYERLVRLVAGDRRLSPADVEAAMERAVLSPEEAVSLGFVDRLLYWQGLEEQLKGKEEKLRKVTLAKYEGVKRESLGLKGKKKIAVVHASGLIGGAKSGQNPLLGRTMGSDTVNGDLRRALEDEKVSAVVFRVDSGGGEAITSDLIGHQVELVKAKKPIVVSMVDVAASGGYSISYRASAVLADTTTITGSIGSISGKFNMRGLYEKMGITFDGVTLGPNGLYMSPLDDWTPEQRARHAENHWADYLKWVRDIARCRGLTPAEVDSLGRGRVWLGSEAVPLKLIDGLGDMGAAIARAKELAGIAAGDKITVVHYPKKKGLVEMIFSGDAGSAIGLLAERWVFERWTAVKDAFAGERIWRVADPGWARP